MIIQKTTPFGVRRNQYKQKNVELSKNKKNLTFDQNTFHAKLFVSYNLTDKYQKRYLRTSILGRYAFLISLLLVYDLKLFIKIL